MYSTFLENFKPSSRNLKLSSANSFTLEESKICHLGKGYSTTTQSPVEPFPKRQILHSSKLREFANDIFKFDENGRKFSNQVKKHGGVGGKEKLLIMSNFSFSHSVFKRIVLQTQKPGLV